MTNIEKFIFEHFSDWKKLITEAPYNIHIKESEDKILLKYNQIADDTDWYSPLVQECRGIILDKKTNEVICHAFDKFFNYGEPYAAHIDWESAVATEKMDGSIIKVYVDKKDNLCISTNGSIDAFSTSISSFANGKVTDTYGARVWKLINKYLGNEFNKAIFFRMIKGTTAIFEFVSPDNQVVIPYAEDELYYLGSRALVNNEEYQSGFLRDFFPTPHIYDISSMSPAEIRSFVDTMKGKEGIVVRDRNNNRVKIKNADYLLAHRSMKHFSNEDILDIIIKGEASEWEATLPQLKERIEKMACLYSSIVAKATAICELAKEKCETKKDRAMYYKQFGYPALLFAIDSGKTLPKKILLEIISKAKEDN